MVLERGIVKEKYKWRYRIFPELERFENDLERTQVLKQGSRKAMRNWKGLCAFAAAIVLCVVVVTVLKIQIARATGLPRWLGSALISGFVGGLIGRCGFQWYLRNPIRKYLRDELVARGVPICLRCGYDLRGQTESRCPECGGAFDERLLSESRT